MISGGIMMDSSTLGSSISIIWFAEYSYVLAALFPCFQDVHQTSCHVIGLDVFLYYGSLVVSGCETQVFLQPLFEPRL
jgi:hypothetical protein